MSVSIPCPRCSCDHLHAAVYVDAESGDRFEVIGPGDEPETVRARVNPDGGLRQPEEAFLSCCVCDWNGDRFIRWQR